MFLGIEIGGTKLQAALGPGDGTLRRLERVRAQPAAGREGICDQVAHLVRSLLAATKVSPNELNGTCIGFGGPVDAAKGMVLVSHQVGGWANFPLVEWFSNELGLAAILSNDSDMAGLAEATFGAGKGAASVVYMNIGSGIGGAIVLGGRLYQGQGIGAGEIGHLRVVPGPPDEAWSTLESLASGWSLAEAARRAASADPGSLLSSLSGGESKRITAEVLIDAAERGDVAAVAIWRRAIQYLGVAIANVITLLCPEVVVIGGGVSLAGDFLFEPLRAEVARQSFAPFADRCRIVPASLGEAVVLHGALAWAKAHYETFGNESHSSPSPS